LISAERKRLVHQIFITRRSPGASASTTRSNAFERPRHPQADARRRLIERNRHLPERCITSARTPPRTANPARPKLRASLTIGAHR
jgi:hypothetical protein